MSYFKHVRQDVVADANNSSSTNLAVGNTYTFTGTKSSTLGVAAIQVSLFADKNCYIKVEQSPDGTNWDLSDTFNYVASRNFGVTVQAISSYVRVIVTTNSETTTVFRLQTALCPIAEPLPRALDFNSNLKIAAPTDAAGYAAEVSSYGEQLNVSRIRIVGAQFDGNTVDPNFWTTATSTGTVVQSSSNLIVTSGTAAGHYASIRSVRRARFVAGTNNKARLYIRLPDTGTANVKRRGGFATISNYLFTVSGTPNVTAGDIYTNNTQTFTVGISGTGVSTVSMIGTGAPAASGTLTQVVGTGGNLTFSAAAAQAVPVDGAYFELDGSTFSLVTCKGGSETRVSNGSFNGVYGYTVTLDTNNHNWEIQIANRAVTFFLDQKVVHKVTASTATWTNTMSLNLFLDVVNSGNSSAVAMYCRAMSVSRLGALQTATRYGRIIGNAATYVFKYGPGRLHKVVFNNTQGTSVAIYDNVVATGGGLICTITTATAALGAWPLDMDFYDGLTMVTVGNNLDMTVIYE